MFNPLHSISNQELFEKHLHNPRIPKEKNRAAHTNHINFHLTSEVYITLRCRLCSIHYTAVRIKNCLKSTSAYQNSYDEKYGRFPFRGEAITCSRQDEWDTKEDTGKSMKNALYVLRYAKRHWSWHKIHLNCSY